MSIESQNELSASAELAAVSERARVNSSGESYAIGPFGKQYPRRKFAGVAKYGFKDPNDHLPHPEKLLAHPEAGMHYAWPLADNDATKAKLRDGHYIKVKPDELDQHTGLTISTHKGTNAGTEVRWYGHVLVKIPPEAWEELYEYPVELSQDRLMYESESFKDKITNMSKGVARPTVELGVDEGAS